VLPLISTDALQSALHLGSFSPFAIPSVSLAFHRRKVSLNAESKVPYTALHRVRRTRVGRFRQRRHWGRRL